MCGSPVVLVFVGQLPPICSLCLVHLCLQRINFLVCIPHHCFLWVGPSLPACLFQSFSHRNSSWGSPPAQGVEPEAQSRRPSLCAKLTLPARSLLSPLGVSPWFVLWYTLLLSGRLSVVPTVMGASGLALACSARLR